MRRIICKPRVCLYCKKIFKQPHYKNKFLNPDVFNKRKFCCLKCYHSYRKIYPYKIKFSNKICPYCKKEFNRYGKEKANDFKKRKFCSRSCYLKFNTGDHHWLWNGGIRKVNIHYLQDTKTLQFIHRKIMEDYLGRKLLKEEIVHHINGKPYDNNIKNLKIMSRAEHARLHNFGRYLCQKR